MRMQANLIPAREFVKQNLPKFSRESWAKLRSQNCSRVSPNLHTNHANKNRNNKKQRCNKLWKLVVNLPLLEFQLEKNVPRRQFWVAPPRSCNRALQRQVFPVTDPQIPEMLCDKDEIKTYLRLTIEITIAQEFMFIKFYTNLCCLNCMFHISHIVFHPYRMEPLEFTIIEHLFSNIPDHAKVRFLKFQTPSLQMSNAATAVTTLTTHLRGARCHWKWYLEIWHVGRSGLFF